MLSVISPNVLPLGTTRFRSDIALDVPSVLTATPGEPSHVVIHKGNFHIVTIMAMQNLLFIMRIAKWKVAYGKGQAFSRSAQLPYFSKIQSKGDLAIEFGKVIDETFPIESPELADLNTRTKALVSQLQDDVSIVRLIEILDEACELNVEAHERLGGVEFSPLSEPPSRSVSTSVSPLASGASSPFPFRGSVSIPLALANESLVAQQDYFGITEEGFKFSVLENPERLVITWPSSWGSDFLKATIQNAQRLRNIDQDPSMVDFMAFHLADYLLSQGANPFDVSKARFLGTVGFRKDTQTYLSLTDPGDGHIFGTTRKSRWMRGAIVHVEHLERPQNLARDMIESYRIPSILDFARVRLHTGYESPNTYFVGRALKDSGRFEHDFVKVVNTTSAAATAAFQLGGTECKVAMDGLLTSQMVAYMRALGGHVLKNHKQYLSAAFNLNHPMYDDLRPEAEGKPRKLTERMEIGRRGIELAILGGFDKCTWDGASDTYPSKCVILQLGFQNALELVHEAHSAGLVTYMSAGFKFHHIADAVYAGVDGIGIGGAQILRYMDYETGMHGPYTEEYIDKICASRDEAANSIRGRGVNLLCRLDHMHYEMSITLAEEALRDSLFHALRAADETLIAVAMNTATAKAVLALPSDGETPYLARAMRLVSMRNGKSPILRASTFALPDGVNKWADFERDLETLLAERDDAGVYAYSLVAPWTNLIEAGRKQYCDGKPYRTTYVTLKTTPYS